MKTYPILIEIIRFLHYIISDDAYCRRASMRPQDFSRVRKMSFTDYIFAIVRCCKTSLQTGINSFVSAYKQEQIEYSKQAFSKGRQRIKPDAFRELFEATVAKFYEKAELSSWHGYHLFGIDGSKINLPSTRELEAVYGSQITKGDSQVQALVSCLYDLMNGIIVDARFEACTANERNAAKDMISAFNIEQVQNPVFIMDRGYPSADLIEAIMQAGYKYVMRCSSVFVHKMHLPKDDNVFEYQFTTAKKTLKVRVVKVRLSENSTEYLVTNLFDENISVDDFKWLYGQRWGIETKYNDVKSKLTIEDFSGYSPIAILQDFWATMMLANLAGIMQFEFHEEIEEAHASEDNKYTYKVNVTRIISELKRNVVEMLMTDSKYKRKKILIQIVKTLRNDVVPIRPNRSEPHRKRHRGAKFFSNLKRIE